MSESVLVAYATNYGSTGEVAETITETLREGGFTVDCKSLREVRTVEGYAAVVLGAPLYMFHWHRDAHKFLSRYRKTLEELPAGVFALGPFHDEEKEWQGAREQLDKELAKFPWFKPVAIEIFGGAFDPEKLRFPYNLIPAMKSLPASDIRDWNTIRSWSNGLHSKFQLDFS